MDHNTKDEIKMGPISLETLQVDYSSEDSETRPLHNQTAKQLFDEYGCFVAKNLLGDAELRPIHRDIQKLIELRLAHTGLPSQAKTSGVACFDDGFLPMVQTDRAHGGVIYDACQRLTPVHSLSVHPNLLNLSKQLMSTETVISCTLKAVRADHPNENTHLLLWHQDYPVIQDSEDGVVFWLPLHDLDQRSGCLLVAPGSHKLGICPVRVLRSTAKYGGIVIADQSVTRKFPHLSIPMQAGDVLVFSTLLLHKSQLNTSDRARWTVQIRHGNFENTNATSRKWPNRIADGHPFEKAHPEYVVNLEDLQEATS